MNKPNFIIIGGDGRFAYMEKSLRLRGFSVQRIYPGDYRADDFEKANVFILPVPVTRDRININAPFAGESFPIRDFIRLLPKSCLVTGGLLGEELKNTLSKKGVEYYDYYEDEALAKANAVPTAEGVIGLMIEALPVTVDSLPCTVVGYGKCGKELCRRLRALGADVTAAVRSEKSYLEAAADGFGTVYSKNFANTFQNTRVLINTVPSAVLGEKELENFPENCLFIEIASAPFGIDFDAAAKMKLTVIKAGSLPGKTAPETAGELILNSIFSRLKEGDI